MLTTVLKALLLRSMLALFTWYHPDVTLREPVFSDVSPEVGARIQERAEAISASFERPPIRATPVTAVTLSPADIEDAASLMVIDFFETTYGAQGVPFGACAHLCRHHCGSCRLASLSEVVSWSLEVLRTARQQCGANAPLHERLAYYHGGTCRRDDAFAHREAARVHYALEAWRTSQGVAHE